MKLPKAFDLMVVDRGQMVELLRNDKSSPLYTAEHQARETTRLAEALLEDVQQLCHELPELDAGKLRNELGQLRKDLSAGLDADAVASLRPELSEKLRRHAEQQGAVLREREAEVGRILQLVAEAMRRNAERGQSLILKSQAAVDEVERMTTLDDLRQIREGLAENLETLRASVEIARESVKSSEDAVREVETLRARLVLAEAQASRDPLTGAYNRRTFDDRLAQLIVRGSQFILVTSDLNSFKKINDTLGHPVGDRYLKDMVSQLRAAFRPTDVVARLGGDEFAVLISGLPAETAASRLARVFPPGKPGVVQPAETNAAILPLSASFGIAVFQAGMTAEELYERADRRVYLAKQQGANAAVWVDVA